ncbi:hypothetical protein Tco_1537973 [Tanacetum coccineum]
MVVLFGLTFLTSGNSIGGYRSLRKVVLGSISPNKYYQSHVRVRWEQWQDAAESDLRSRLMAYSLVRLRKSGGGYEGLKETLYFLEAPVTKPFGGCDQNPLEATITKLADVKVLVAGSGDVVLETISVTIWILNIWRLCHDLRGERNLCKELDDEGNLTEGVDWEAERLNAISGRFCERLGERLCKRFSRKLFRRFGNWYMFGTEGRFKASGSFGTSGSFVDRLSIFVTNLVTSRKEKVKRWMFKGVKAFSHVNFDEYICVAQSEGLLIAGKEDPTCVETLYGWVVGFDEEPWEASSWEPWGFPIGAWYGFDVPSQGLKKVYWSYLVGEQLSLQVGDC